MAKIRETRDSLFLEIMALRTQEEQLRSDIKRIKDWKMLAYALSIVVISLVFSAIMGFSNSTAIVGITYCLYVTLLVATITVVAGFNGQSSNFILNFAVGIVMVIVGVLLALVLLNDVSGARLILSIISLIITITLIAFASYNRNNNNGSYIRAIILVSIFGLVAIPSIYLCSFYHNAGQLKRDQKIADVLLFGMDSLKKGIVITLPAHPILGNHEYLSHVLSYRWSGEGDKTSWKNASVYCSRGEEVWYEAELKFPNWFLARTDKSLLVNDSVKTTVAKHKDEQPMLTLSFDHVWEDQEITIPVPLPDSNQCPLNPNQL